MFVRKKDFIKLCMKVSVLEKRIKTLTAPKKTVSDLTLELRKAEEERQAVSGTFNEWLNGEKGEENG